MLLEALVAKANRFLDSSMFVSFSFVYEINAILFDVLADVKINYAQKLLQQFYTLQASISVTK